MSFPTKVITPRTLETHAYYIPHVGLTNTQAQKSIIEATFQNLPNVGHIYEEILAIKESRNSSYEYDIREYYEKYSPTTAKTLIDTLFLPRHAICRDCAKTKDSPVYTDRLIYTKELLLAVEVALCQRDDVSCFKYLRESSENMFFSQYDQDRDYMLVYSCTKTNAASIFYTRCRPQDIFDIQSLLRPSIHVMNRVSRNPLVNTQLYHRYINNYYVRISKAGCTPMTFYRNCDTPMNHTARNDAQDPLIYEVNRLRDDVGERRKDRSSLLLLEPLLLKPGCKYQEATKNRGLQSENTKIFRIIMAYALSFFILASITFYIVYFT
ncbi:hypothetical protein PUN28_006858 [Cardiocondyla obscurior]|uniref:Uncharacterized protein n=1 Tax=Cardiocondyla obscurior TaxID=286306 RepID=A0AAW2G368_9HYME